jgi:hypothetical protein
MKKLLLKIKLFFATIFGNLDRFITDNVDEAINVVDAIKKVVDSPVVGVIVKLTPTKIDDNVLDRAKGYLDIAIKNLALGKECSGLQTKEERLKCLVEKLAEASPHVRSALYLKIASLYAKAKAAAEGAKNAATTSDVDTLVQLRYKNINL